MHIMPASKLAQQRGIRALILGRSGSGKSWLVGHTAPGPILMIDFERGQLSNHDVDADVAECTTVADIEEILAFLESSQEAKKYQSIALDSVSEMAEINLRSLLKEERDGRKAYALMGTAVQKLAWRFRALDAVNVFFLAQSSQHDGRLEPLFPGQALSSKVPYWFDLVLALWCRVNDQGVDERFIQCRADQYADCKSRGGRLDKYEPANLSYLLEKLKGVS